MEGRPPTDKPTPRTLYGVFAEPVRLDGDLTPRTVDALARGGATPTRRNSPRRRGWAVALTAVSRLAGLVPARSFPRVAKR